MKLKIKSETLMKLVSTVYPAVSPKMIIPAHGHIKIEAENGVLALTASDNVTTIQAAEEAIIEDNGSVGVSGKIFYDLVNILPPCEIRMEIVENRLRIKAGRRTMHLNVIHPESFPMSPNYNQIPFSESENFFKYINKVSHAVSKDETRRYLMGISLKDDQMVATDGHRLALIPYKSGGIEIIVPLEGIDKIKKVFTDSDLRMCVVENSLHLLQGKTASTIRLVDRDYPPIKSIIPNSPYNEAIVKKDELVNAIKMVKAAQSKMNKVRFDFSDGMLHFETSSEVAGTIEGDIECQNTGNFTVFFNSKYLMDAIEKLDEDVVKFQLRDPLSPMSIVEGDFIQLVMPMKDV